MNMIEEIRKSLERLEYYEALAEQKQDAWDADPSNPGREEAAGKGFRTVQVYNSDIN